MNIRKSMRAILVIGIIFACPPLFAQEQTAAEQAFEAGMKYYKEGLYESAIIKFKDCVSLSADNIEARYMLGLTYHLSDGNYQAVRVLAPIKDYPLVKELWEKSRWTIYSLNGEVRAIVADERYLWVGTDEGLSSFHKERARWFHYDLIRDGLESKKVTHLTMDETYLYVVLDKVNVWSLNKEKNSWFHYYPTNIDGNITFLINEEKCLWISTDRNKLYVLKKDSNSFILLKNFPSEIRKIDIDNKYLWVTLERKIQRYDKAEEQWQGFSIPPELIGEEILSAMAIDMGNFWWGTENGFFWKYDRIGEEWGEFSVKETYGKSIKEIKSDNRNLYLLWRGPGTGSTQLGEVLIVNIRTQEASILLMSDDEKKSLNLIYLDDEYLWMGIGSKVYGVCKQ